MAEPMMTLEQKILAELVAKRQQQPKPWETLYRQQVAPAAVAAPAAAQRTTDPLALAAERAKINDAFGQYGKVANPETMNVQQGQPANQGLIALLMSLMGK